MPEDPKRRSSRKPRRRKPLSALSEEQKERRRRQTREAMRRYRAAHKDRCNASTRKWRQTHPEANAAMKKRWAQANPEKMRQWRRKYREKIRALRGRGANPQSREIVQRHLLLDPAYAAAAKAVPRSLPSYDRDDIISSIVLAFLQNEISLEEIPLKVSQYVSANFRQRGPYMQVSLDQLVPGTDRLTYGERISSETFHF